MLDLSRYTESTRRHLYDLVVAIQFTPPHPDELDDLDDVQLVPTLSPDDAGLTVFYAFGRWFAAWEHVNQPDLVPDQRLELVRIEHDPLTPDGILLYEL